jgi:hypothetical protein
MRRAFASFWYDRLTDQGRDFALCLGAVPGAIITGTALALLLAPILRDLSA